MRPVELVEISELTLMEDNPRTITKKQLESLYISLRDDPDFLEKRPVLVNRMNGKLFVYAGNQRVTAAKWLGWNKIPCIVDENLDENVVKKRILIDNRHSGEWDYDLLANNFDLDLLLSTGFTEEELELKLPDLDLPSINCEDASKCEACGKKITKRKR